MAARVFLTDFGLARDTATGSRYTRSGATLGTPAYMSPEQACGEGTRTARGELATLTPATDVWSLGCVLYECVAGRRAFDGETDAAVVGQVLLATPPRLGRVAPQIPRGLDTVVRVCLGKRAGARYRDAGALRDELDRVPRGERPLARVPRRARWNAAVAALAVAAAATLVALGWHKTEPGASAPPSAAAAAAESLAAQAKQLRTADPRQAADLLRRALDLTPSRDDWRLERGLLLWAIGEGADARRLWSEIRLESPEATVAQLYRGLEALFRSEEGRLRTDEAESDLRAAAAIPGRDGRLARAAVAVGHQRWGEAREALRGEPRWEASILRGFAEGMDPEGDRNAAVREYTRGMDDGIRFAWALTNRGAARASQGDLARAIEDYGMALELDPKDANAWNNRGNARMARGDLAGAIDDHGKAIELGPRFPEAWNNRGAAREARGDLAGAVEDYGMAVEMNPRFAEAWKNLGNARRARGDVAGAIQACGKALELDPTYAGAWNDRGNARRAQGDLAGAIEDYGRALELDSRRALAWSNRGAARIDQGDLVGAIDDFGKALDLDPRDALTWCRRGNARHARRDLDGAIEDYGTALEIDPRLAEAWVNRGSARRAQGDPAGAIEDYGKAVEVDPRLAEAWYNRGAARRSQGDSAGAIADYQQALAVAPPGWSHRKTAEANLAQARAALAARGGK